MAAKLAIDSGELERARALLDVLQPKPPGATATPLGVVRLDVMRRARRDR
jgi:hypothetical protein